MLVLSAQVGESHTQMALTLANELERQPAVESVTVINDFSVLGPALDRILSRGFSYHLGKVRWSYDLAYRLFKRKPARSAGERALRVLGGRWMQATIGRHEPDVIVSTYPVMNPVLAGLRAAGRLDAPVVAIVGPLGGLGFWVQPGLDLHLALYPEALPAIRRLAGRAPVKAVRPLVAAEYFEPGARARTREELGIPGQAPLVLISGGGWGAGDVSAAVETCLGLPDARVLAVCGRNEALRRRLAAAHLENPRVTVIGFTSNMHDLLWAADAFVSTTAGSSCIEARLCGCPTVTFGYYLGHIRDNVDALAEHELAQNAQSTQELGGALRRALRGGRIDIPAADERPQAAGLVLALAGRERLAEMAHPASSAVAQCAGTSLGTGERSTERCLSNQRAASTSATAAGPGS